MAYEKTTLKEVHNFWFHQFDAVLKAAVGLTGDQIAEAMITVGASRLLEKTDHDTVAARLAMVAGGLHAMGEQAKAEEAATTRH